MHLLLWDYDKFAFFRLLHYNRSKTYFNCRETIPYV